MSPSQTRAAALLTRQARPALATRRGRWLAAVPMALGATAPGAKGTLLTPGEEVRALSGAADRAPGLAKNFRGLLVVVEIFLVPAALVMPDLAAVALPETVAVAMVVQVMADEVTVDPVTAGQETAAPATAVPETVDPATADLATADPETTVPATADLETAVPATADLATAVPATADPETADPETTDLAMAVPATVAPATADPATADPETADPETETVDLSAEQAFFARAVVLSDHPVSFDTESRWSTPDLASRWPTLDLEEREQRRAHFTRVVGVIVGTLGVGALLALTRPGPPPMEAAPISASSPVIAETAEIQPAQPEPTVLPELSVSAPDASASSTEAAPPSGSAPAPLAPAASAARSRKRAPQAPAAARVAPAAPVPAAPAPAAPTPAEGDKRPPPTARFSD